MTLVQRRLVIVLLFVAGAALQAQEVVPLLNWPVGSWPESAAPHQTGRLRVQTHGDITASGTKFVPVTPCRLVDTRDPIGPFGGPAYTAGESRTYQLPSHPICTGLPATAVAFSLNFTIVNYNVNAGSYVVAYPAGTTKPYASTVNFGSGPAIGNAAIVTATAGGISVFAGGATHVIIDINGYFLGSRVKTMTGSQVNGYFVPLFAVKVATDAGTGGELPFTIFGAASPGPTGNKVVVQGTYLYAAMYGIAGCLIEQDSLVKLGNVNVACGANTCTLPGVADPLICFNIATSGWTFTPAIINVTFDLGNQPGTNVYTVP